MDNYDEEFEKAEKVISENFEITLPKFLPGGIQHPDDCELIGQIPVDDGLIRIPVTGLLKKQVLEIRSQGISVHLDRPFVGSTDGTICGRIIHDVTGTIYIFRKDVEKEFTSYFIILFGHQ